MKRTPQKETAEDNGGAAPGGIQALDAALSVLRVLRSFDGPATLSDIAREAGMPPSKVHRYLASFMHAGLAVQKERSGRYDLGPEAASLVLRQSVETTLSSVRPRGLKNWPRLPGKLRFSRFGAIVALPSSEWSEAPA